MKIALVALISLITVSLFAQESRIEEVDKSPVEAKFSPGGQLYLDLCSSGVELKGVDNDRVRVSYHADREPASNVRVRLETVDSRAKVKVTGCPHNNFRVTIEVPKSSDLYVRMFAGELEVRNITGNKDVQLHAGQLTMDVGEPADYGHVDASVSSGELDASAFNVNKGGLFRSFDHTGPGKYRLHAHVGAGELDLR
jgi:hypothetical protein